MKRILAYCLALMLAAESTLVPLQHAAAAQADSAPGGGDFTFDSPDRKDPFIAGLLSWTWPGLGQFYTQNYAEGSFFLMADLIQKGLLIYMLSYYSDKYTRDKEAQVKWKTMDSQDKTIIIGYLFSFLVLRVACVINAVSSAETYNKEIYFPYWKSQNKVRFSLDMQPNGVCVGITSPLYCAF
jgi:hypothetical protein